MALGVGVWDLGFGTWDLGLGGWGFGIWDLGFGGWGLGFGVWIFARLETSVESVPHGKSFSSERKPDMGVVQVATVDPLQK